MPQNWWDKDEDAGVSPGPAVISGGPRLPSPVRPVQEAIDQATLTDRRNDNANAGYVRAKAAADARKAEADARKAEREANTGQILTDDQQKFKAKLANLDSLVNQINRVDELYRSNIAGQPADRAFGLTELLPTPTNKQFDAAGAGLAEQGLAAFRVPGVGSQSDTELRQFVAANKPSASDYDETIEEKLRQLRGRVDATRKEMGLPPAEWRQQDVDRSELAVGEHGGDRIELAQGSSRTENNPAWAGVNDAVHQMIVAGKSNREILSYLKKRGYPDSSLVRTVGDLNNVRQWRSQQHPRNRDKFKVDAETWTVPLSRLDQIRNNAAQSAPAAYLMNAADGLSLGTLDNLTADPALTRAGMDQVRQQHPYSSMAGTVSGAALTAAGAELGAAKLGLKGLKGAIAGDLAFGAGYGAGSTDEGSRLLGAAKGAAAAGIGGQVGRSTVSAVGKGISGARNEGIRYLNDRGIPLTIGDIAGTGGAVGRAVKGLESKLESIPFLGDAIKARRAEGYQAFNREAFSQALEPIGQQAAGNVAEEGVESARSAVSGAYSDALDGVNVGADKTFVRDMRRAMAAGQRLPGEMQDHFRSVIETAVAPYLENGRLTGEGFQAVRQALRIERAAWKGKPSGNAMSNALRQVEGAMEAMVRRKAPSVVPGLNAADKANRLTKTVENAVERGVNTSGVFTPAQLGMASRQSAKKYGGNAATTERPFFDLQRHAQDILPSTVPSSGTTDRAWASAIPLAGAGIASGTGVLSPEQAAIMASLGLPFTKVGQATFQKMLVSRPDLVRLAGEKVLRRKAVGGLFGAPIGISMLPSE
jgi:hypothetical protein